MANEPAPPAPENRPKMWRFYRERNMTLTELARVFDRTKEWCRLITLPFDDPRRRIPSAEDIERAFDWSGGEITPADWYPPRLSPAADQSEVAAS